MHSGEGLPGLSTARYSRTPTVKNNVKSLHLHAQVGARKYYDQKVFCYRRMITESITREWLNNTTTDSSS